MKFLAGFAVAFVAMAILGFGIVESGAYDVAATNPHTSVVAWALHTDFEKSVERQAKGVKDGPEADANMLREGFREYDEACVSCHGAPGVKPAVFAQGMLPRPPELTDAGEEFSRKEIYWIARHGVKMTGMPAFGPTHPDEEIWAVASFVKSLPDTSAEDYAKLRKEVPAEKEGGEGGGDADKS